MAPDWVADLAFVIEHASREELEVREADRLMRKNRKGEQTGVQGMILDAMDDGHIEVDQAYRLLVQVQERLRGKSAGLCRLNRDGDLIAIGSTSVEKIDGR